ncbi:pyruvate dehydrogenase complex dihydrolipoamide acetyltransferase [Tsuneonella sp. SYSU-LHT278]|uniref:pyruvate dehydrogenase complex dihydrolipoamide acetyltransferase n=1 Tax=Tsuneonella sediminis TaxID=3416089 RepID=UPI003F7A83A7
MPTPIKMPALSPTMEEGTLARWLVKEGDTVSAGDVMAEIETDKATMEFEAVDEGTIAKIEVAEGTEGVKVGTVIAMLAGEGEDAGEAAAAPAPTPAPAKEQAKAAPAPAPAPTPAASAPKPSSDRVVASPLAKRIAEQKGIDLAGLKGSGPNGRIVKADVEGAQPGAATPAPPAAAPASSAAPAPVSSAAQDFGIPHTSEKLSGMRKTIARRLTESKQQVPHIYLTVDVRLDALLKLRGELNKALEPQGVKLSVNDLMIKALAKSLIQVPKCNVQFAGDELLTFSRADISVAVSVPTGLITPIVKDAGAKSVSAISTEMKDLAGRAKEGKLKLEEFQGGTASLSNMGMYAIKQFEAVINPPQGMIMAIGAGEKRPYVVDDALAIATVMSATGSFDHRAIDGADGAELMQAFKALVEAPLGLVA